jgi:Ca-activated chloride channel family protein
MRFADPYLLAAGLVLVAALTWAAVASTRRRTAALAAAGAAGGRRRGAMAGLWLTLAGLAVLAVGAGAPSVTVPVARAAGTVILAVDVSGSMTATDVSPTRLAAAKTAARGFINAQPSSVDIGVVAFEQGGLETAAPSPDHTKALAAVGQLQAAGGTSLGAAILAALSAITHKTVGLGAGGAVPDIGYWPSATVVLLSDGGTSSASASGSDSSGTTAVSTAAAAATAQKAGVHIDTVGVGTASGATIDVDGYHLFTALDAGSLRSISSATGGSYHPASDASQLNGIASTINLRLTVTRQPLPLAGALILLALVLLAAGAVLTVTRTGRVI